jgi:hypothetical protein
MEYNIIVCTNGFVFIGVVEEQEYEIIVTNCYNVRKYGTDEGIGQLALSGATPNTILDFCGIIRINKTHLIYKIVEKIATLIQYSDDSNISLGCTLARYNINHIEIISDGDGYGDGYGNGNGYGDGNGNGYGDGDGYGYGYGNGYGNGDGD